MTAELLAIRTRFSRMDVRLRREENPDADEVQVCADLRELLAEDRLTRALQRADT